MFAEPFSDSTNTPNYVHEANIRRIKNGLYTYLDTEDSVVLSIRCFSCHFQTLINVWLESCLIFDRFVLN